VTLVAAASVAGCSHGARSSAPTTPQERAIAVCRSAAPKGTAFLNATAATVGEVRKTTIGTAAASGGVLAHDFAPAPEASFAAWCWARTAPATYVAYAVGPDGTRVIVGTTSGNVAPPDGNPAGAFL
jgi:hypothetical protein